MVDTNAVGLFHVGDVRRDVVQQLTEVDLDRLRPMLRTRRILSILNSREY